MPAGVTLLALLVGAGALRAQEPKVEVPQPLVPEVFTLEGEFVRVAYNNEGYVTLGYRLANASVGEEWMLLEVGVTLRRGVEKQKLNRGSFTLDTPGPVGIPMATQEEFAAANLHGALLLVHGSMDENVHMQSTLQFAYALQDAGRPFDMMIYPRSRHRLGTADLEHHRRATMLDFVLEHLRPAGAGAHHSP